MQNIVPIDENEMNIIIKGKEPTKRSKYIHSIIKEVINSKDKCFEIKLDENGEEFSSNLEACKFYSSFQTAAKSRVYKDCGCVIKIKRRDKRLFIVKEEVYTCL